MKKVSLILASGEGSRLYPLSTKEKPKQFLSFFDGKMMIEHTFERFQEDVEKSFVVSLNRYKHFFDELKEIELVLEEEKKETSISVFSGLSAIKEKYEDVIVIQSPSDHYINELDSFKEVIKEGIKLAEQGYTAIVTVQPTFPDSGLGYAKGEDECVRFVQKPEEEKAKELIKEGYGWNTAIYIYPLNKMITRYREAGFDFQEVDFETLIVNGMKDLKVVQGNFHWSDIGTLERLEKELDQH